MLSGLIAYDASGNVVASLAYMMALDEDGHAVGLIDFAEHEAAGKSLRDIWEVSGAVGSGTWPEWLGTRAHEFRVERDDAKRLTALIHRGSGHRRDRSDIEKELRRRRQESDRVDARDLLGGPDKPLLLDEDGRTMTLRNRGTKGLPVLATARGNGAG